MDIMKVSANVWVASRQESVLSRSEMQSMKEKVKNEIKLKQKNNIALAAPEAKLFQNFAIQSKVFILFFDGVCIFKCLHLNSF